MFSNIVVGVDGSEQATRALRISCDLAKHYNGRIHLVHTPQLDTVSIAVGAGAYDVPATPEQIQKAGQEVMSAAQNTAKEAGVIPASTSIGNGAPAVEILDVMNRHSADLIVTGRRGLGRFGSLLMGSTSQKVAHDANCACLTVM